MNPRLLRSIGNKLIITVVHMPKISPIIHLKRLDISPLSPVISPLSPFISPLSPFISPLTPFISPRSPFISPLRPMISVSMWFSLLSICSRDPSILATLSPSPASDNNYTISKPAHGPFKGSEKIGGHTMSIGLQQRRLAIKMQRCCRTNLSRKRTDLAIRCNKPIRI